MEDDLNRVNFYSKEDMAGYYDLSKREQVLRSDSKGNYTDINDVLGFYNIKKYLDNGVYLANWG